MPFPILIAVSADRQTDRDISILQYYAVTGSGRQGGKQSKTKRKQEREREREKKESKQIACDKWLIMLLVLVGDGEM